MSVDLIAFLNKKFGKLTVIGIEMSDEQRMLFKCACECGKEVMRTPHNIKTRENLACQECRKLPEVPSMAEVLATAQASVSTVNVNPIPATTTTTTKPSKFDNHNKLWSRGKNKEWLQFGGYGKIGDKHGNLIIVKILDNNSGYECKCACGNMVTLVRYAPTNDNQMRLFPSQPRFCCSRGCRLNPGGYHKVNESNKEKTAYGEQIAKVKPGAVFNRLTVVSTFTQKNADNRTRLYAVCDCSCGKRGFVTRATHLPNNKTRSCGCLVMEHARSPEHLAKLQAGQQKWREANGIPVKVNEPKVEPKAEPKVGPSTIKWILDKIVEREQAMINHAEYLVSLVIALDDKRVFTDDAEFRDTVLKIAERKKEVGQ